MGRDKKQLKHNIEPRLHTLMHACQITIAYTKDIYYLIIQVMIENWDINMYTFQTFHCRKAFMVHI